MDHIKRKIETLAAADSSNGSLHEQLDADLVRGSSLRRARWKKEGNRESLYQAWIRVLFFPFFPRWWAASIGRWLYALVSSLWVAEQLLLVCYYGHNLLPGVLRFEPEQELELVFPLLLLAAVADVYAQCGWCRAEVEVVETEESSESDDDADADDDDGGGEESSDSEEEHEAAGAGAGAGVAVTASGTPKFDLRFVGVGTDPCHGGGSTGPGPSSQPPSPKVLSLGPAAGGFPAVSGSIFGRIKVSFWKDGAKDDDVEHFRLERAGRKALVSLPDLGRVLNARVRKKRVVSAYLRTGFLLAAALALALPFRRAAAVVALRAGGGAGGWEMCGWAAANSAAAAAANCTGAAPYLHDLAGESPLVAGCPRLPSAVLALLAALPWSTALAAAANAACGTAIFYQMALVERLEAQRGMRAKYFEALTSRAKSRRFGIPHFRLHKVAHVRMWVALRSHLRHQGPYQACSAVVSRSCSATLLLTLLTTARFLRFTGGLNDGAGAAGNACLAAPAPAEAVKAPFSEIFLLSSPGGPSQGLNPKLAGPYHMESLVSITLHPKVIVPPGVVRSTAVRLGGRSRHLCLPLHPDLVLPQPQVQADDHTARLRADQLFHQNARQATQARVAAVPGVAVSPSALLTLEYYNTSRLRPSCGQHRCKCSSAQHS
jgi:hypothetical protein